MVFLVAGFDNILEAAGSLFTIGCFNEELSLLKCELCWFIIEFYYWCIFWGFVFILDLECANEHPFGSKYANTDSSC